MVPGIVGEYIPQVLIPVYGSSTVLHCFINDPPYTRHMQYPRKGITHNGGYVKVNGV